MTHKDVQKTIIIKTFIICSVKKYRNQKIYFEISVVCDEFLLEISTAECIYLILNT